MQMAKIQVMKKNPELLCCTKDRSSAGFVPLVLLLLLLGGCTVGNNVAPHGNADDLQVQNGSTVARPATQTKGFVLKEKANLGVNSRRDFDRAVEFLNNDDFEKAIELLEKIVETSPGVTAPYINLAIAYRKIGKPGPAEEHLKAALKLFPKHPVASNEYGLLLRTAGRFTEARNVYEATIAKYPEYLPARKNLAILCDLYLNDQDFALAQYELYSEVDPGDEQVKLWISELRLRQGK
jgi:Tfp pilus assembly protein PilF